MKHFVRLLLLLICAISAPAQAQIQEEIRGIFYVFTREANAHNTASVGQMLLDSQEFTWTSLKGAPVKGRDAALLYLNGIFRSTWRIEPNLPALNITTQGLTSARLQVPVRFTFGEPGNAPETTACLMTQVFVSTPIGWRISSIAISPLPN